MDTTKATFERDVIEASREQPVMVDFWAPWCGPCRVLGPVLERLAAAADARFRLVKVDTEAQPDLALAYDISSIPHVKLFRDGKVVADFSGAMPEAQVVRWLERHVPSPVREALEVAARAVQAGARDRAASLLRQALELEPDNCEVRVRLAELVFADDRAEAAKLIDRVGEGDPLYENADGLRCLARFERLGQGEAPGEVNTASAAWPAYQEAARAFARGDHAAAVDRLIEALRRDRKLDDDGARRACVALFRWLGDTHAVTQQFRRVFASALY